MSNQRILLWMLQGGSLDPWEHESVDEAVVAAYWRSEDGDASPECIEVIDPSYNRLIDREEMVSLFREYEKEQEALRKPALPTVARIRIKHRDQDRWGTLETHTDLDEAQGRAVEWRSALGQDRVRLELPDGSGRWPR